MATPWYLYPQDTPGGGYGEMIDPVCAGGLYCHYLKPDTNIAVPSGVPITSLFSGTVTDVSNRGASDAGLSVTVRLDNAINSLAQYISYNYLGSASVVKGQHISSGEQVGVAGSPTGINFAVALGSDPVWGSGPGFQQNAVGNPLLDPRPILKEAANGTLATSIGFNHIGNASPLSSTSGGGTTSSSQCAPWDVPCIVQEGLSTLVHSDFFTQSIIVTVAIILILIGVIVLAFGHGAPNPSAVAAKAA